MRIPAAVGRLTIAIAAAALALAAAPPLAAQGDALIVPGEGVGVLRLGNPVLFVKKDLEDKRPSSWRVAGAGAKKEMWLSYDDHGLTFVFDYGSKLLKRIVVTAQALLVEGTSIHVGSRRTDVLRFMGEPLDKSGPEMDYPQRGIKFVVDAKNVVTAIEIREKERGGR